MRLNLIQSSSGHFHKSVRLHLKATRGYGTWKPRRKPSGRPHMALGWSTSPGLITAKTKHLARSISATQKKKSWRLIIAHNRGVSLYAPGFYALPMALRHCWKQIRAWMALGSRGGRCGARCAELGSPFCSAAVLQESTSKPASARLRREQKPLMPKNKFPHSPLLSWQPGCLGGG